MSAQFVRSIYIAAVFRQYRFLVEKRTLYNIRKQFCFYLITDMRRVPLHWTIFFTDILSCRFQFQFFGVTLRYCF